MQFSIEKYKIHSNELQQAYKSAQQYVIDSAHSAKQKISKIGSFLSQLICTYASQIYTYAQNATHGLLPSRVSIINLKEWVFKTPVKGEEPRIQKTIDQPLDDSKIPAAIETSEKPTEMDHPTLETIISEVKPPIVPIDSNTAEIEQYDVQNASLLMAAVLTAAVAMKAFKGQREDAKPESKPFSLEGTTTSQKQRPEPSSNLVTDEIQSPVEPESPSALLKETHKLQSDKMIYRNNGINRANREQGIKFMYNPFEAHKNRLVPWQTMTHRLKPNKRIYPPSLLTWKAILLRFLKPRV